MQLDHSLGSVGPAPAYEKAHNEGYIEASIDPSSNPYHNGTYHEFDEAYREGTRKRCVQAQGGHPTGVSSRIPRRISVGMPAESVEFPAGISVKSPWKTLRNDGENCSENDGENGAKSRRNP